MIGKTMSGSYVDGKVREALAAANGSRAVAQKILISMAAKDPQLLLAMAQPFLQAIAAAAIERVLRRARTTGPSRGAGTGALSREALARVLDRMGRDDGEPDSGGGSGGAKGTPARAAPAAGTVKAAPQGASHEKSMLAIAKAFAAKKVR